MKKVLFLVVLMLSLVSISFVAERSTTPVTSEYSFVTDNDLTADVQALVIEKRSSDYIKDYIAFKKYVKENPGIISLNENVDLINPITTLDVDDDDDGEGNEICTYKYQCTSGFMWYSSQAYSDCPFCGNPVTLIWAMTCSGIMI